MRREVRRSKARLNQRTKSEGGSRQAPRPSFRVRRLVVAALDAHESLFNGVNDGLGAVADLQLGVNVGNVVSHCALADG